MSKLSRVITMLGLLLLVLACQLTPQLTPTAENIPPTHTAPIPTASLEATATALPPTQSPTSTQEQPAPLPSATATEIPTASGPCQIIAAGDDVTVYSRPSLQANIFGQIAGAGFPIPVQAQTSDGWLGFDPGVAQAANTGVFRNRWVQADQVELDGDCQAVPVVVGPAPGVCFTMPLDVTPVYPAPDTTSTVIVSLVVEQYAAVLGRTNDGWAKLDLSQGNSGSTQMGWISEDTLNFNGPCENLPIITP